MIHCLPKTLSPSTVLLCFVCVVLVCNESAAFALTDSTIRAHELVPADSEVVESRFADFTQKINIVWVLVCAVLVFMMQGGFLCVEAGLSRAKNSINVAMKNVADVVIAVCSFWLFGFGIMFGASWCGLFGTSLFMPSLETDYWLAAFFVFQAVFCGTVATIDSGAVAERTKFGAYLAMSTLCSALIYPVFGHWAWGSLFLNEQSGWLESLGFIDFAGSTVVHSTGGWVALAGVIVIGPRMGKFIDGKPQEIRGHNIPMILLGAFILFFGWFGFNCGSTLEATGAVSLIAFNTLLAGCFGGLACAVVDYYMHGRLRPETLVNGILGGLVAITAGCALVSPLGAIFIGSVAGVVVVGSSHVMQHHFKLDDVVGAIPVHGFCGAWGTIALAVVMSPANLPEGMTRMSMIGIQALGVAVCFLWAFPASFVMLKVLNHFYPIRVSEKAEMVGLNVYEHGATSGFLDLQDSMRKIVESGEYSKEIKVEPEYGTEVGDLGVCFNEMIDAIEDGQAELFKASEREELLERLVETSREAGMAEIATGILHSVGNSLNSLNVSTNILKSSMGKSKLPRLRATVELMEEHDEDLPRFIAEDPRGRRVVEFLRSLCERLEDEAASFDSELDAIAESLQGLTAIVSAQQEFASASEGVLTEQFLARVTRKALTLMQSSFEDNRVTVNLEVQSDPLIIQDEQKVIQVLISLLRNANDAVLDSRAINRCIDVHVGVDDHQRAFVEIRDYGCGIEAENITAIFNHGFSTKRQAHGFGLHCSANAIASNGGKIRVHSDGIGTGATFVVTFPVKELAYEHEYATS